MVVKWLSKKNRKTFIQKGDAVLQVPMIKHREIACSDDFEVLEIVSPGDFVTKLVDSPD